MLPLQAQSHSGNWGNENKYIRLAFLANTSLFIIIISYPLLLFQFLNDEVYLLQF